MSIKEDIEKVEKKMKRIEEESFAMELVKEANRTNRRIFAILIIVLVMWFATIGAFLYYINTIDYQETVEQAEIDNESGNANACIGDNCNNGEISYGKDKVSKKN